MDEEIKAAIQQIQNDLRLIKAMLLAQMPANIQPSSLAVEDNFLNQAAFFVLMNPMLMGQGVIPMRKNSQERLENNCILDKTD